MFFTLFGYWAHVGGGVSPKGLVQNVLIHPGQLKNRSFQNLFL